MDEVCRLRVSLSVSCALTTPCLHTLSLYASSPHFVPTLCRKRKSKRQKCIRPDQSSSSSSPVLPCLPCLPVLPADIDRRRQDRRPSPNAAPVWRGHSCLRWPARAGRPAPHCLPCLSPRGCTGTAHSLAPHRPLPTPVNPIEADCRRHRHPSPSHLCHRLKSTDICDICACEAGHLRLNQFPTWRPWHLGGSKHLPAFLPS